MYYRNAAGAIVEYDVTSSESLGRAKAWVKQLEEQASGHIVLLLAGNKLDLAPTRRTVQTEEAQAFAEAKRCLFVECSAKTGEHVFQLFESLARQLPDEPADTNSRPGDRVSLRAQGKSD